jgi:hypothetical protein
MKSQIGAVRMGTSTPRNIIGTWPGWKRWRIGTGGELMDSPLTCGLHWKNKSEFESLADAGEPAPILEIQTITVSVDAGSITLKIANGVWLVLNPDQARQLAGILIQAAAQPSRNS